MKHLFVLGVLLFLSMHLQAQLHAAEPFAETLHITAQQKAQVKKADDTYLHEMSTMRHRAATGYNAPKHIQLQHVFSLIRRLELLEQILTPEQFAHLQQHYFDIAPDKNWLAAFYKKHGLLPIEAAVAKKQQQLKQRQ